MAAGKSLPGLQIMAEVFKDRSIHKYYQCIVAGKLRDKQTINGYLTKDERTNQVTIHETEIDGSVPILTEYEPLAYHGPYTLLKVTLITGRSHQIRAHLASIGHSVVGDYKDVYKRQYQYSQEFQEGDTVTAGQLLGYMGDSGYSTVPGTVGNFDVHLHLGIYLKTDHFDELSVNPYWILRYLEKYRLKYSY